MEEKEWRCSYCGSLILKSLRILEIVKKKDNDYGRLKNYDLEYKCKCGRFNWIIIKKEGNN